MIYIKNLSKLYDKNIILDNISLEIKKGSLFGLLGPNGAGKTTLVSILNSLVKKDGGEVFISNFNLDKEKNKIKEISSYVPQSYAFYPNLTVQENLEFFGAIYGLEQKLLDEKIIYCSNITALNNFKNQKASKLSGGLKRRLNIAIGLLNSPAILYLDEPTVGIDPQSRQYILDTIKDINKTGTTIIYTSHYMEEVEYLCDEIAILDNHKIILNTSKEDLLKEKSIIEIKLKNEIIKIDVKNSYDDFLNTCKNLKNKNKTIENINFSNGKLEEVFLNLTKKELRD